METFNSDMLRLCKSKRTVDISSNTIRKYAEAGGIRLYRVGKAVFFSRSELEAFIKSHRVEVQAAA